MVRAMTHDEMAERIDRTDLDVESTRDTDDEYFGTRFVVSGVHVLDDLERIGVVLQGERDGVEVEWIDGDSGVAELTVYEVG